MRPVSVYTNATLAVKSGDKYLLRQKRQRLTPGEMIDVNLSKDILKNANPKEGIVFSVEEG